MTEAGAVSPVVFEIVQHRLRSINDENGTTIVRSSGSPVVVHGGDFNTALLLADGEYVLFGRNIKIHAGVLDLVVEDVLEHFGPAGIHDGDQFLSNDPWVGPGHQNDVAVVGPVFGPSGELRFWTCNILHYVDIGGSVAGGRSARAKSAFEEATIIPPVKVVERGRLRSDIARLVERQSRVPPYAALDLRAQVAGNTVARQRLREVMEEFGEGQVLGVAGQIISGGAHRFRKVLAALPDGVWREQTWLDGASEGDRGVYRVALRLEKRGEEIELADDGSDPQLPAPVNCAFGAWRSGIICALLTQLGPELALAPGGALRHVTLTPRPGTLFNARHPAPVNRGTSLGFSLTAAMTVRLLARLVGSDLARAPGLAAPDGSDPHVIAGFAGVDDRGSPFFRVFMDTTACGSGAFVGGDGDATGGSAVNLGALIPNVEDYEAFGACLYLFRREERGTGGAGEWVGGNALAFGVIPFGATEVTANVTGWGVAFPPFPGNFGGYPPGQRYVAVQRSSDLWARVHGGTWPGRAALAGELELVSGRAEEVPLGPDDVLLVVGGAGAGVGDPLHRTPAAVAADVAHGAIDPERAADVYGVVLRSDGRPDDDATDQLRARLRAARAPEATGQRTPDDGFRPAVAYRPQAAHCAACGEDLGGGDRAYRSVAVSRRRSLVDAGLARFGPERFVDASAALVEWCCPGCGELLEVDVDVERAAPGAGQA